MTSLRTYQRESIDAILNYWQQGEAGNPLIELATGTGKSVVLAQLKKELLLGWPLMRVLVLVHVRELVAQNYQQLLRLWPQAPAGINSAGLGRRDFNQPIIFASVQSVYKNPERLGKRDLVLIDEAHLTPQGSNGMYHKLLDGLRRINPNLRVAGCTATPYRLDSGRLDKGKERLFDRIVYSYGIHEGVRDGYLSPLTSKGMKSEINVKDVAKRGGEFIAGALEKAADQSDLVAAACDEIIKHGGARRSWLLFCSGVDHAAHVSEELVQRGISSAVVTGETPKSERDRILTSFKAGSIRAVCNMSVLTTGFDAPNTDLIAMLRPTLSTGLYVQMLGRGTRIAPTKKDCLVLDFSGNVRRHGPVDLIDVGGKSKGEGAATDVAVKTETVRAKECPECSSLVAIQTMLCPDCGHHWQSAPKHEAKADSQAQVMSGRDADGYVPVSDVQYYKHEKKSGSRVDFSKSESPTTLRVSYGVGVSVVNDWKCFSHPQGSYPQRFASSWWLEAGGKSPVPVSVDEALARCDELRAPAAIKYAVEDGFKKVVARCYVREAISA